MLSFMPNSPVWTSAHIGLPVPSSSHTRLTEPIFSPLLSITSQSYRASTCV
jgi:hypothetical protein